MSLPRHANRRHAIVQAVLRTVMLAYELQVRGVFGDIEGVVAIVGVAVQRCAPSGATRTEEMQSFQSRSLPSSPS